MALHCFKYLKYFLKTYLCCKGDPQECFIKILAIDVFAQELVDILCKNPSGLYYAKLAIQIETYIDNGTLSVVKRLLFGCFNRDELANRTETMHWALLTPFLPHSGC